MRKWILGQESLTAFVSEVPTILAAENGPYAAYESLLEYLLLLLQSEPVGEAGVKRLNEFVRAANFVGVMLKDEEYGEPGRSLAIAIQLKALIDMANTRVEQLSVYTPAMIKRMPHAQKALDLLVAKSPMPYEEFRLALGITECRGVLYVLISHGYVVYHDGAEDMLLEITPDGRALAIISTIPLLSRQSLQ